MDAYKKAFSTDTVSPFGGIVVVNKELDLETAQAIDEIFTEIIIAPSFSNESLQLLTQKKKKKINSDQKASIRSTRQIVQINFWRSLNSGCRS